MTREGLERRVEMTGWSSLLLGLVCVALAVLEVAIPVLLRELADTPGLEGDQMLLRLGAAFAQGAALSAAVNVAFGLTLVFVGWSVARLRPWSHRALTAVSWASIPAMAALAVPSVAPLLALGEETAGSTTLLVGASVVLVVLQAVAVLWFLRFWRREDVRALFG